MSDRSGVLNKYKDLSKKIGRAALSSFYPNDIEYYICAFELVSSSGTENYFAFPIQPSAIQKSEPVRTNIKKSLSGITVLKNNSFIPQELTIKGNFGRKFKILTNLDGFAFSGGGKGSSTFGVPTLSNSIKTGYGATKLLQKILNDSNQTDHLGKPKRLYFYNLGFGESYLVTIPPSGISFSQTEDMNMIWGYNVNMLVLAHLGSIFYKNDAKSSNKNILSKGVIQKSINTVANEVKLLIT